MGDPQFDVADNLCRLRPAVVHHQWGVIANDRTATRVGLTCRHVILPARQGLCESTQSRPALTLRPTPAQVITASGLTPSMLELQGNTAKEHGSDNCRHKVLCHTQTIFHTSNTESETSCN